ncbi:MAG: hypothetical protein R2911_32140 [Caldilineaceae bacterium]
MKRLWPIYPAAWRARQYRLNAYHQLGTLSSLAELYLYTDDVSAPMNCCEAEEIALRLDIKPRCQRSTAAWPKLLPLTKPRRMRP